MRLCAADTFSERQPGLIRLPGARWLVDVGTGLGRGGHFSSPTAAVDEPHVFAMMFIARRPRVRRFPDDFAARRSVAFSQLADRVSASQRRWPRALHDDEANEVALTLWAHAHGLILLQRGITTLANDRSH